MLGYCPIPLYPNSIDMIVLNFVLHSARRKLSMKLEPHLPAPLSSCLPPLPHASFPFAPFLPFPLPCTPPPSVFPMDCLPIDSYCICTSLFIILPPILSYLFLPYLEEKC